MRVLIESHPTAHTPESLFRALPERPGRVLLRTGQFDVPHARYSIVTHQPTLTLTARGTVCQWRDPRNQSILQYGNPWDILAAQFRRFELGSERDVPFPLGGAFGYWGYEMNRHAEPRIPAPRPETALWPDCMVGFHSSLVVFDHLLQQTWIISTGLGPDGSPSPARAAADLSAWKRWLDSHPPHIVTPPGDPTPLQWPPLTSSMNRDAFLQAVARAQAFIRSGDIYQVNLTHTLHTQRPNHLTPESLFERLSQVSPAPFSALMEFPTRALVSTSPELFLRISGRHVVTRPIKGTRPRSPDPAQDARWSYELQTSPKESAELVMITDLLRNDLGRICEYGSVRVPDLLRLERYRHVQHLVSTIEGDLRPEMDPVTALRYCFPGGSITGAPKVRAMEIIRQLEPVARGPYCGCLGYLGFNQESQLSIVIRTALMDARSIRFPVGAGIVADSDPACEWEETLAKARGFIEAGSGIPNPNPDHGSSRTTPAGSS